ncbi:hypothetical protein FB107DRAFT_204260 [Schizophyllum commune]
MQSLFSTVDERVTICSICNHDATFQVNDLLDASGYPHSPAEAYAVEQSVARTQDSIMHVRREMAIVGQKLIPLHAVELKLLRSLALQRNYLAPIRRSPVKILEIILELSCLDAAINPSCCTPLHLSAVCKQWRAIILCSPRIWTNLQLTNLRYKSWSQRQAALRRLKLCLDRTNGIPLSQPIYVNADTCSEGLNLAKLLLRHTEQWQHLQADHLFDQHSRLFNGHSFPRLHTLDIDAVVFEDPLASGVFLNTPSLRSVTLGNPQLQIDLSVPDLPWSQLHELHTTSVSRYAFGLLSRCPNLTSWMHDDIAVIPHGPPLASVTVPHLRALQIRYHTTRRSSDLDFIVAPALRSLDISYEEVYTHIHPHANYAATFLHNCQAGLQDITLRYPHKALFNVVVALDNVRSLFIHASTASPILDETLDTFWEIRAGEDQLHLPKLEELALGGSGFYRGWSVVTMVEGRRLAGLPLQMLDLDLFSVDMGYFGSLDVLRRLRELVPHFFGEE